MEERIYFSGLWLIDGNRKKSEERYRENLSSSLRMIAGEKLHFFYDDGAVLDQVLRDCSANQVRVVPQSCSIEELPAWNTAAQLVECCRAMHLDQFPRPKTFGSEKCMAHYWRDYTDGGAETYRSMLAIWISKVLLMAQAAQAFPENDETRLCWIDASIARFNHRRTAWNFARVPTAPDKLSHYQSPMTFLARPLPLNASFLCATSKVWQDVCQDFLAMLEKAQETPYAHDEETILAQCIWADPTKFAGIGRPVRSALEQRLLRLGMKST
jgi:hypothetical protein